MATHEEPCAVCGTTTACCNDEHALGCGGGCYNKEYPPIEFCSVECFLKLRNDMDERLVNYLEIRPDKTELVRFLLLRRNGVNVDHYFKQRGKK